MSDGERDFAVDVKINRFRLEEESEIQPSLYHYWADLLADAKARADKMDDRLKLTLADTEMNLRYKADRGELEIKLTEASIKALMEQQETVQAARKNSRDAWALVYHLESAVKALEHRKAELDNLTQLWRGGYYAKPDGGKRSAGEDVAKDMRKNLNKNKNEKGAEE